MSEITEHLDAAASQLAMTRAKVTDALKRIDREPTAGDWLRMLPWGVLLILGLVAVIWAAR